MTRAISSPMTETVIDDADSVSADGGTVSADAGSASADAGHLLLDVRQVASSPADASARRARPAMVSFSPQVEAGMSSCTSPPSSAPD
jgi:hypothetical protein